MASKDCERGEHRSGIALAEFAAIHRRIHVADQIEDCRERLRGIQIVRKPAVEIFLRLTARLSIAGDAPAGNFSDRRRETKFLQALH